MKCLRHELSFHLSCCLTGVFFAASHFLVLLSVFPPSYIFFLGALFHLQLETNFFHFLTWLCSISKYTGWPGGEAPAAFEARRGGCHSGRPCPACWQAHRWTLRPTAKVFPASEEARFSIFYFEFSLPISYYLLLLLFLTSFKVSHSFITKNREWAKICSSSSSLLVPFTAFEKVPKSRAVAEKGIKKAVRELKAPKSALFGGLRSGPPSSLSFLHSFFPFFTSVLTASLCQDSPRRSLSSWTSVVPAAQFVALELCSALLCSTLLCFATRRTRMIMIMMLMMLMMVRTHARRLELMALRRA
mmetsp:Transcript_21316/g.41792  ORF Transcript_21316/g.41792 Transcript_21316/m.41792 type:complete len:302 (+) Transcript_21316:1546-2451(+)